MKPTKMSLILGSALTLMATGAFAQSFSPERYDTYAAQYYRYPAPSFDPDWQFRNLSRPRNGYIPDARGCTPGLCQEDPYY